MLWSAAGCLEKETNFLSLFSSSVALSSSLSAILIKITPRKKNTICVCVCGCVCVCVCLCVCKSIHRESFICLDQLECQGTDQRYYVEDVSFVCQVPSSLLQNEAPNLSNQPLYSLHIQQKRAEPRLNQCVSRLHKNKAFI